MTGITTLAASCSGQTCCDTTDSKSKADIINNETAICDHCGKTSCDGGCSSNVKTAPLVQTISIKNTLPSCNLSESQLLDRKAFLQSTISKKIKEVKELETGYDLIFHEPKEYAAVLLDFINFERGCCSSFTYGLIFEPNNKATHLQIYGSKAIKEELSKGLKELGLIK